MPTYSIQNGTYITKYNRVKLPYYVAIQDNNNINIPAKSNVLSRNDGLGAMGRSGFTPLLHDIFINGNETLINCKNLFGVHFINKPMGFDMVNAWAPLYELPVYGSDASAVNTITCEGAIQGYVLNGVIDKRKGADATPTAKISNYTCNLYIDDRTTIETADRTE